MPIYDYQCVDCSEPDQRVGGVDDHTAICMECGGLMLRLNEDVWQEYFAAEKGLRMAGGDARPIKTP
jgi:putative FmdB family regulatory protein